MPRSALACLRFPVSPPAGLSVCPSGFLSLYPFPLGEQSIPGCLSESLLDVALPAVPYNQSLVTTCGRVPTSCSGAEPYTALGSPVPVCSEHPCRDRELLGWEGSV